MIVISDTSPVLNLARIGRPWLLRDLYEQILIPPNVYQELKRNLSHTNRLFDLSEYPWLAVLSVSDEILVAKLHRDLDIGEAEAIVLAIEQKAGLLLMDEKRGREKAVSHGLKVIGLLGVIMDAKQRGIIQDAKPLIDDPRSPLLEFHHSSIPP